MLYNYYMKNKFFRLILLFVFCFFTLPICAQMMVVRIDGNKVYLDTSSLSVPVQKGELFKLILSFEKLTNPKTGKDLGLIYHYSPEGKIIEVQPLYAVGQLPKDTTASIGQEAVISSSPLSAKPQPVTPTAVSTSTTRTKTVYVPIEQEVISVTQADVTAPGSHNFITLSKEGIVTVWTPEAENQLKEQMRFSLSPSKKPLTLSAVPVKPGEAAQIFAAVYDNNRQKISTLVLEAKNGTLQEVDSLPYFVKELGCGTHKTLWAQKTFVSASRPGNARQVIFKDGKFAVGETSFSTQRNWLLGLTSHPVEDPENNLIYTAANGTLRLTLKNGKRAESKDLFASSPNRVKYKQEILSFYPSVQAYGPLGAATVAAVENKSKLGVLAETFGQYKNGKIHFLSFEKGRLNIKDTVELDGVIYDTACTDATILTAEVLPDSTSSLVEILK